MRDVSSAAPRRDRLKCRWPAAGAAGGRSPFSFKKAITQNQAVTPPVIPYSNKVTVSRLFANRWDYSGRKPEVHLCINRSVNKTKGAAASSLYKRNSFLTEHFFCAFSSPTLKQAITGENLCKPIHFRNTLNHRNSSPFISAIFVPVSVLVWPPRSFFCALPVTLGFPSYFQFIQFILLGNV